MNPSEPAWTGSDWSGPVWTVRSGLNRMDGPDSRTGSDRFGLSEPDGFGRSPHGLAPVHEACVSLKGQKAENVEYADGDVEFAHSYVDKYATVSISFHERSYPNLYVVIPLIIDGILHMDTQFLVYMDCGLILMDGEGQNQHTSLCLGLNF